MRIKSVLVNSDEIERKASPAPGGKWPSVCSYELRGEGKKATEGEEKSLVPSTFLFCIACSTEREMKDFHFGREKNIWLRVSSAEC